MDEPVTPRDAATVMLLRDDPFRVLMVRRNANGSFPSALVFPGGTVEPEDLEAGPGEPAVRAAAIRETFEETGVRLHDPEVLVQAARWVTPATFPRRWDTRFYLAPAPDGQDPAPDGAEIVAVEWVQPREILSRAQTLQPRLILPTLLNLRRISESADIAAAIAAAMGRPEVTVHARIEDRDGARWHLIPEEAGYGVTEIPSDPWFR